MNGIHPDKLWPAPGSRPAPSGVTDRGCTPPGGIGRVVSIGGHVMVRVSTGSLPFHTARGASLDLSGAVMSLVAGDAVAPGRHSPNLMGLEGQP